MPEFTGEQKLRIVLESIIRKVPSEEQCQKYGVSLDEFENWRKHLTENGGKIFEPGFGDNRRRVKTIEKTSPATKFFLILSLLINLAVVVVAGVLYFEDAHKPLVAEAANDYVSSLDSPLHDSQPSTDFSEMNQSQPQLLQPEAAEGVEQLLADSVREPSLPESPDLQTLLAKPQDLPSPQIIPPVEKLPDVSAEVSFLGEIYEGRHVVFALDVGDYVLQGDGAAERFEKTKDAVLSSLVTLSPNSYFNLVLYWNLREASALGKTILKANRENVKYAVDWITGLGSSVEDLRENRNQFVPKELLYSKPLPGVVGPWFGLSVGISFDPDLIFVLAGNNPSFPMSAVPKSHFNGLDLSQRSLLNEPTSVAGLSKVTPLTRQTAIKWLTSLESPGALPDNVIEVEKIALRRLGLGDEHALANSSVSIPWEKVFENFLSSLELNAHMIPQSHFFLCLPPHVRWPNDLFNTASEFAESSKGSLVEDPQFP